MEASNPYSPPSAPVRDIPEGTTQLAGRGARLGATLLDGLFLALLIYVPYIFAVGASGIIGSNGQPDLKVLLSPTALLSLLPGSVIYLAVTIWLVIRNRQTIGKKLVGIKVVRTDGSKVGLGRLFWLRNVVLSIVNFIPVVGSIIGGILGLVDVLLIFRESRKCLHDQIADTIVINA